MSMLHKQFYDFREWYNELVNQNLFINIFYKDTNNKEAKFFFTNVISYFAGLGKSNIRRFGKKRMDFADLNIEFVCVPGKIDYLYVDKSEIDSRYVRVVGVYKDNAKSLVHANKDIMKNWNKKMSYEFFENHEKYNVK